MGKTNESDVRITVLLTSAQKAVIDSAAKEQGLSTAAAVRTATLKWAREMAVQG